jgi:kinesin family member 17
MEELKREYEKKLSEVSKSDETKRSIENSSKHDEKITERIKSSKDILIGGERANDTQLKEKRFKKKLAAQKKIK